MNTDQAADADQNENYAPPYVSNDITVAYDTDGFCSTFSTVGSAVAGMYLSILPYTVTLVLTKPV